MNIIVVTEADSWFVPYARELVTNLTAQGHSARLAFDFASDGGYDICFLLSYGRIVPPEGLARNRHNIVVHESALPAGKGWSPLTWQVLEGRTEIPITLFEASAAVDAGHIYLTDVMHFRGTELVDELRAVQGRTTLALCERFVREYPESAERGREQVGEESFYPRRRPADSRLDVTRSIAEQFNLLRVCDNERYPAYFEHAGERYTLKIYRE